MEWRRTARSPSALATEPDRLNRAGRTRRIRRSDSDLANQANPMLVRSRILPIRSARSPRRPESHRCLCVGLCLIESLRHLFKCGRIGLMGGIVVAEGGAEASHAFGDFPYPVEALRSTPHVFYLEKNTSQPVKNKRPCFFVSFSLGSNGRPATKEDVTCIQAKICGINDRST